MRAAGYCLARFVQQGIAPVLWPDMLSFAGRSPGSGFAASFSVSCILQGLVACHAGECQTVSETGWSRPVASATTVSASCVS